MRPVSIVVLAKYKEVFEPFAKSVSLLENAQNVFVVRDGTNIPEITDFKFIQGPEKFEMAGNGNLGLKAVPADHDILYCGDDVRFLEKDTISKLQEVAYLDDSIGMVSPRIIGRGSPTQINPPNPVSECVPIQFWFPCVYIKRDLI